MGDHNGAPQSQGQKPPPADFYVRQALREDAAAAGESLDPSSGGILKNPLVPLGMAVTAGVLVRGLYHFMSGNSKLSQRYMRYRVAAQFVTVCALGFGAVYLGDDRTRELLRSEREDRQQQKKHHNDHHNDHHNQHHDKHHNDQKHHTEQKHHEAKHD